MTPEISLVIPVYNEIESLPRLFESLDQSLAGISCEIILVDDGSKDGSFQWLERRASQDKRLRLIQFTRNFGQTAAMAAGFESARGEIIVSMDGDGQNDPADIPNLLSEIRKGNDVVSGWRADRQDPWLSRLMPSHIANSLISFVTGVPLHDYGCTLKAFRWDAIKDLRLYGEMHRFIPAWCAWHGARISEIKVLHHARARGKSKYGIGRTFKVVLDLITAKFFFSYLNKPIYVLGGLGMSFIFLGFWAGLFPFVDKFILDQWGHLRIPFMILSVFLGLLGAQFVVLGLLAEVLVRIYYESNDKRPYRVAKTVEPNP